MGAMIQLTRPDGQSTDAYLSGEPQLPGLVVVQEWWGLNDQIKSVADRLAEAGFYAIVPDLYHGKLTTSPTEAQQFMTSLDWSAAVAQDIAGSFSYLKGSSPKVGILGFCMGGALTLISAAQLEAPEAAVCFYGIPPEAAADVSTIRIPLQAHFANTDDWCTPTLVSSLENRLESGQVNYELYRYDAQHAFMNDARPEVYNREAAQIAWDRAMSFLKTNLA